MVYTLIIKEEALTDALNAYLYYEEKSEGLGEQFLQSLNERLDFISKNPQHYSFTDKT